MASNPCVHSYQKALSAIAERLPREFKGKAALSRRLRLFKATFPFFPFCLIFLVLIFSYFDFGIYEFSTICGNARTYYRTGRYTPKPYKPKTVPFLKTLTFTLFVVKVGTQNDGSSARRLVSFFFRWSRAVGLGKLLTKTITLVLYIIIYKYSTDNFILFYLR